MVWTCVFLVIVTLLFAVYKYFNANYDYWKKRNVPFIKPFPVVGNIGSVLTLQKSIGKKIAELHSLSDEPFIGFFSMNKPALLVRDLNLIQAITTKDFHYFADRNFTPDPSVEPMGSKGLFALKGEAWKQMRSRLTPNFTSTKLKNMFHLIQGVMQDLDELLESSVQSTQTVDIKDLMARFTTDVIAACAFGINGQSLKNPEWEFRKIGNIVFKPNAMQGIKTGFLFFAPWILKLFRLRVQPQKVYTTMSNVVLTAIDLRKNQPSQRNDFLDLLLKIQTKDDEKKMNTNEIISLAFEFLVAAYDTSSTTMSLTLYELALNQDVQEKARDEIRKIINQSNDSVLTYDSIQEMHYLNQIISETLRKYPTLPFLDRICLKKYQIPNTNISIDPGTKIFISLIKIQNDPKYFSNPEKFNPDRFSKENIKLQEKYSYFPFGQGPRNCIGSKFGLLQSKAGLAQILLKYRIIPCSETIIPIKFNPKTFTLTVPDLMLNLVPLNRK